MKQTSDRSRWRSRLRSRSRSRDECGMMTIQYVLASALALIVVLVVCNALMNLYVRAAVRDALDDGTRAAIANGSSATVCQQRVDDAVGALVHGAYSRGVHATCSVVNGVVHADAQLRLPSLVPLLIPAWTMQLHAVARQERL